MEARIPINFITTPAPTTAPATTISAGSDISGANYRPRVTAAVATPADDEGVDDGGGADGSAATVTGCVGPSGNAHWKF